MRHSILGGTKTSDISGPFREVASATDRGRVRSQNEDHHVVDAELGLLLLADGMGGCRGGEIASAIAVDTVLKELRNATDRRSKPRHSIYEAPSIPAAMACRAISAANAEILRTGMARPEVFGMGTTLVSALVYDQKVCIANVGDSRAYRIRDHGIEQLTVDHTLYQERLDMGEMPAEGGEDGRNILTRALGTDPELAIDVQELSIREGDIFLLCSDGLYDMVNDTLLLRTVTQAGSLANAAGTLIDIANDRGGLDNITVVLGRV